MTDVRAVGGGSPGNREIGRLGTREVRGIGRLEGPGSGLSSGLPPRTPFSAKSKKNGVRKCSGSQKLLRSDLSGTSGPKLGGRAPSFPRFLRFGEGSRGIFFVPEALPRELSAFPPTAEHGGFRGPCPREMRKSGNREIWQRTEGRQITDDEGRRWQRKEERRKMTDGERRK